MRSILRASVLLGCVLAVACGGQTTSSTTSPSTRVSGTVAGGSVPADDSVALFGTDTKSAVTLTYAGAVVSNVTGICGVLQGRGNPPNATTLVILTGAAGTTPRTGSFAIGTSLDGETATVGYAAHDGACNDTTNETASSGTVVITRADSERVSGTFDASFASGDHLTGAFDAPVCAVDLFDAGPSSPCGTQ